MTSSISPLVLDDNLALRQAELAALIQRQCPADGLHSSAIAGLDLACATQPSLPIPTLYRPCLCIIAQGRKDVRLGDEQYTYDPLNYLVASVTLPVTGQVIGATPEQPYLSLRLDIDPALITSLIADIGPIGVPNPGPRRALYLDRLDTQLLDAYCACCAYWRPRAISPCLHRWLCARFSTDCCTAHRATVCTKSPSPTARASASTVLSSG